MPQTFTICFSGTACTRDEGEATRDGSDKRIYDRASGYIPVRIHTEISGSLTATSPSVTVRGVGENDWAVPRATSEPLVLTGPLAVPPALLADTQAYSGGDQRSTLGQITGRSVTALALHAANLAAASGATQYNFIGHSRGAVASMIAAWFLYAYGPAGARTVPINIFAIDPVPGPGNWDGTITQLAPTVASYAGVYSWDHISGVSDPLFMGVVPRPNRSMLGQSGATPLGSTYQTLADGDQLADPLAPGTAAQPQSYALYACRGKHSTVAGNSTADGQYDATKVSASVAPVPALVYKLARAYLTRWGTTFRTRCATAKNAWELRRSINTDHARFDAMGGGATREGSPKRYYVRALSAFKGSDFNKFYYMDDVAGDPPYELFYPVTSARQNAGWVKWTFL